MTSQPESTRSAALRELLVDVADDDARRHRSAVIVRTAIGLAAVGVGVVVLIVALNTAPNATQEAVPAQPTSGSVADPSSGAGSRAKMYTSLDELIADSSVIVVGVVSDQQSSTDGTTVFTVAVEQTFTPATLGATSPEPAVVVDVGGDIRVRTFGAGTSVTSAPLEQGGRYLLFLTATGLPTAGADEFFVTGVVAGIYRAQGDGFARVSADGDVLPAELSADELE